MTFKSITERKRAEEELNIHAAQQAAVAELGQRALAGIDLSTLMNEAVATVARTLAVEYCKVLELLPGGTALLLRAGVGWKDGSVGHATVGAETDSQAGYTLLSHEPVIVEDLRTEPRFSGPPLLHDHGVVSGMSVIIQGPDRPFGVLGAHTARERTFTKGDIHFLQAIANVLAAVITRTRTEEVLRETNVALANAMPGISRLDPGGRYVNVNEVYARMLGYKPSEIIGMDWKPTIYPDDQKKALAAYECMLSEGKAEFEARAVRKDGSVFYKHVLMVKIVDKHDTFIGHHCFMRDITERKQAEATRQALYQASLEIQEPVGLQQRLDRLLQTAQTVLELDRVNILLADPQGRMLQAVASLGVEEPLEAIRVPIGPEGGGIAKAYLDQQMIAWDGLAPVPEPLRLQPPYEQIAAFRSQIFANVPLVVQGRAIGVLGADRKRSRRPIDAATLELLQLFAAQAALAIEHGRLYEAQRMAAIQLGATVEARTRELQAANIRLEAASRHKSEFLANMSHELRTPLNSILGFSELLQQQTHDPLPPKQARYVDNIHASGKHLLALISELLDLSKVEAGKLALRVEPFALSEALAAALREVRPLADAKGLTLELQVDAAPATLMADPVRFKQILHNLLSNAIKFTPEQGRITLSARRAPAGPDEERRWAGRPGADAAGGTWGPQPRSSAAPQEWLEIRVTDTGIGIRAEDLPCLFQEFVQLEKTHARCDEGTGLGLALTKRLIELHGGRIWVESEGEGRGSTFIVLLPFDGPAAPAGALAGPRHRRVRRPRRPEKEERDPPNAGRSFTIREDG